MPLSDAGIGNDFRDGTEVNLSASLNQHRHHKA